MEYPIGRYMAIQKLDSSELEDLHNRENKRGFLLPLFNLRTLYMDSLKTLPENVELGEFERKILERKLWENAPKFEDYAAEEETFHPSLCDLDFMHDWDKKLYHLAI